MGQHERTERLQGQVTNKETTNSISQVFMSQRPLVVVYIMTGPKEEVRVCYNTESVSKWQYVEFNCCKSRQKFPTPACTATIDVPLPQPLNFSHIGRH